MRSSESIKELAAALAAAQAEIKPPAKSRTAKVKSAKADYTYQYCDLADLLAAIVPPLAAHGLALSQGVHEDSKGNFTLETRLMHASGEWQETDYPLAFGGNAQEKGSELTYARRYSLSSLVAVCPEDDRDGAGAGRTDQRQQQRPAWKPRQEPTENAAPRVIEENGRLIDADTGEDLGPADPKATGRQVAELRDLMKQAGPKIKAGLEDKWLRTARVKSLEDMSSTSILKCVRYVRGLMDAAPHPAASNAA